MEGSVNKEPDWMDAGCKACLAFDGVQLVHLTGAGVRGDDMTPKSRARRGKKGQGSPESAFTNRMRGSLEF